MPRLSLSRVRLSFWDGCPPMHQVSEYEDDSRPKEFHNSSGKQFSNPWCKVRRGIFVPQVPMKDDADSYNFNPYLLNFHFLFSGLKNLEFDCNDRSKLLYTRTQLCQKLSLRDTETERLWCCTPSIPENGTKMHTVISAAKLLCNPEETSTSPNECQLKCSTIKGKK